jgi:hypothetical protein
VRLLVAILLAVVSGPAFAHRTMETRNLFQVPKSAVISDEPGQSVADRGRIAMAQFARCVVDRRPALLERILRMPIGSQYQRKMGSLATDECLDNGQMSFQAILFRGALFAELWRRRVLADRSGEKWGPVMDPIDFKLSLQPNASDAAKLQFALQLFADCIVMRDRAAASDVVLLPIASKEQNEAYARLAPNLGACLPNGKQVKFSKPALEGILAEVLYRSPLAAASLGSR